MNMHHILPTEEECYRLMEKFEMLPNIVAHSVQVMKVSLAITDNLINDSTINRELVKTAALLHDIAKTHTIKTGESRHDLIGGEMLREIGYDSIAEIVEQHIMFENFNPDGAVEEREIVFYADKRVMHDRIVTIDERVNDIAHRYRKYLTDREVIELRRIFMKNMERKIQLHMSSDIEIILADLK